MGKHASIEFRFRGSADPDLSRGLNLFLRADLPRLIAPQYMLLDNRFLPRRSLPRSGAADSEFRLEGLWLSASRRPLLKSAEAEALFTEYRGRAESPKHFSFWFAGNCDLWYEQDGSLTAGSAFRHISPVAPRRLGSSTTELLQSLPPLDAASWGEPPDEGPRAWKPLLDVRCAVDYFAEQEWYETGVTLLMHSPAFIEYSESAHINFSPRSRVRNWLRVLDWVQEVTAGEALILHVNIDLHKLGGGFLDAHLRERIEAVPKLHELSLPPG